MNNYPVDIEVRADEWEARQKVLKELAMAEEKDFQCEQCGTGFDKPELIWHDRATAECAVCGNVWQVYHVVASHGLPEEAWEYADHCRDRGR